MTFLAMIPRRKIPTLFLACTLGLGSAPAPEVPAGEVTRGGEGGSPTVVSVATGPVATGPVAITVDDTSRNAFGRPLGNMRRELWQPFRQGKRFFSRPRAETAGGALGVLGGLGPLMNATSCSDCHFKDGRGGRGEAEPRLLARLSVETRDGSRPDPVYGGQLQDRAVPGVAAEGRLEVVWEEMEGRYGDGEVFALRRPSYHLVDLAYGPPQEPLAMSPRMPPALLGLGLLEAVPVEQILAWADPEDGDGDGISGRPQWVPDLRNGGTALGRFGWKAGQPTLEQQNAAALAQDLGVTNELHPAMLCTPGQKACRERASTGGAVEAKSYEVQRLTLYTQLLAVPSRRGVQDPAVGRGETLFQEFGCAGCHRPDLETGAEAALPELTDQKIHPYTDLLLHDLGEELADGRGEHRASGREWRTPPLWGLGILENVSGTVRLLHDGRARSLAEAILWHGGEAEASREAFRSAQARARRELLSFLESL